MQCPILCQEVCIDSACKYYETGEGCTYEMKEKEAYKKLSSAGVKVEQKPKNRKR